MSRVATGPRRPGGRWVAVLLAAVSLTPALAGCDSNGEASGKVAQAKVTVKEKALTDAKSDFADKSAAACDATATYIRSIDRYGDVLTQTAATVGDVKVAGADLVKPAEEAVAGAQAAQAAQEAVVEAEQELADAQVALVAATSTASSSPSTSSSKTSPAPTPSAAARSVDRVREAESQFSAAQQGITDKTPLASASQQFNAAAVALEMSWLRLFADAGCLTGDQQKQAEKAVHDYTSALQKSLKETGYYDDEVDGVYGPATVDAVEALQKAHGLPTTGTVDKATADALQADLVAKGGAKAQDAVASTAAVQQTLKLAGFWDGPVDGIWTPALTQALEKFQTELGVKATGTVDAATVAALEKAIAQAGAKPTATIVSPSPKQSSSPSPTKSSS